MPHSQFCAPGRGVGFCEGTFSKALHLWFSCIAFGEDLYCFLLGMSLFYIWQVIWLPFHPECVESPSFSGHPGGEQLRVCLWVWVCECEWETQIAVSIGMGSVVSSCRSSRVTKGSAVDQCPVYIKQALSNREVHKGWSEYEGDSIHWFSIFTASSLQIIFCLYDKKNEAEFGWFSNKVQLPQN